MKLKLAYAFCFTCLIASAALAPLAKTYEHLPPTAAEITLEQIKAFFGTNDVKGLPLLDPQVDWKYFTNWPTQFKFNGLRYDLEIRNWSTGTAGLMSRDQAQIGVSFWARYLSGTNIWNSPLQIYCIWSDDGSIENRCVVLNGKTVFVHAFAPRNQFHQFVRCDVVTGTNTMEYYDEAGHVIGTKGPGGSQWNGVPVDEDTLSRLTTDMYVKKGGRIRL